MWKIQLTVSDWGAQHIINTTSAGRYSVRLMRSGDLKEERCGILTEAELETLRGNVNTLRASKNQLRKAWPSVGIDLPSGELDVLWADGEAVGMKLPILAPSLKSEDPPPEFLNELVVFLWGHRNAVHDSCGASDK